MAGLIAGKEPEEDFRLFGGEERAFLILRHYILTGNYPNEGGLWEQDPCDISDLFTLLAIYNKAHNAALEMPRGQSGVVAEVSIDDLLEF